MKSNIVKRKFLSTVVNYIASIFYRITEDGDTRILENGDIRILE